MNPAPADGFPPSLRRLVDSTERRNGLFAQLIFASRNLAQSRLVQITKENHICADCGAMALTNMPLSHRNFCRAEPVLLILAELTAMSAAAAEHVETLCEQVPGEGGAA